MRALRGRVGSQCLPDRVEGQGGRSSVGAESCPCIRRSGVGIGESRLPSDEASRNGALKGSSDGPRERLQSSPFSAVRNLPIRQLNSSIPAQRTFQWSGNSLEPEPAISAANASG